MRSHRVIFNGTPFLHSPLITSYRSATDRRTCAASGGQAVEAVRRSGGQAVRRSGGQLSINYKPRRINRRKSGVRVLRTTNASGCPGVSSETSRSHQGDRPLLCILRTFVPCVALVLSGLTPWFTRGPDDAKWRLGHRVEPMVSCHIAPLLPIHVCCVIQLVSQVFNKFLHVIF